MENYQIEQRTEIDFTYSGNPPRVYAKQYDNSTRVVAVDLYDGGKPYTAPSGYSANIRMNKLDGHHVYNPAVFSSRNTVLVLLTQQMLTHPGELMAEIEIVQGEYALKTATFIIYCAPSVIQNKAIQSTDEYKTMQEILALVEEYAQIVEDNKEAIDAIPGQIQDMQELVNQAEEARQAACQCATNAAQSAADAADQVAAATAKAEEAALSAANSAASEDRARQYAELAGSISNGYKGFYTTPEALRAAYPTGENGWIAAVGRTGDDTRDTLWAWDSDANDWVNTDEHTNLSEYPTWGDLTGALLMPCNCIYADGTHEITYQSVKQIPGTRYTIVMIPTHDYTEGDTVTVAGEPAEVHYSASDVDVRTGAWQAGKPVQVEVNGDKLYIQGGPPVIYGPRGYIGDVTLSTRATDILAPSWEGKTTVIGEPSPDNPATITGVPFAATATSPNGESRSVDLGFTGYSLPSGVKDTYDGKSGDVVRRVGKFVFDGTESISSGGELSDVFRVSLYITEKFVIGVSKKGIFTHFPYNTDYNGDSAHGYISGNKAYLYIPKILGVTSIESAMSWLAAQAAAGTPVTVYDELAEPIAYKRKVDIIAFSGQTTITGADTVTVIDGQVDRFGDIAPWEVKPFANAGAHNSIYRGMYLGDHVTDDQYAAIANGTFEGLYIGDYWIINGIVWRIAAFDYYFNCGDTACTTHHIIVVPDTVLYNHVMNDTNTTEGGYYNSKMRTSGLDSAKATAAAVFGAAHILSHREYLTNAVTSGCPSAGSWYDCTIELMNEMMVYGSGIFLPVSDGTTVPNKYTVSKSQLPLFRFRHDLICNRVTLWLRDVVTAARFSLAGSDGRALSDNASLVLGVRPAIPVS